MASSRSVPSSFKPAARNTRASRAITVVVGPGVRGAPGSGDAGEPAAREDRDLFVVGRVDKLTLTSTSDPLHLYLYRPSVPRKSPMSTIPTGLPGILGREAQGQREQSYKMLTAAALRRDRAQHSDLPDHLGKAYRGPAALHSVLLTTPFGFSLSIVAGEGPVAPSRSRSGVVAAPRGEAGDLRRRRRRTLALTAKLDRAEVVEGDPVTLSVRVEGVGNVKTFSKPRLPDLPQFKLYDSDSKTEVQTLDRVSGSRTYEIVLVPRDEGEHDVPPIRLAYFDTGEGRYRTLETKPLHITAVRSSDPNRVVAADQPAAQRDIQILGKDIGHIHTDVPISDVLTPLWSRGMFGCWPDALAGRDRGDSPAPAAASVSPPTWLWPARLGRAAGAQDARRRQRHRHAGHCPDFYADVVACASPIRRGQAERLGDRG